MVVSQVDAIMGQVGAGYLQHVVAEERVVSYKHFLTWSSPGVPELKRWKLEMRNSFSSRRDTASSIGFFILKVVAGCRAMQGALSVEFYVFFVEFV